VHPVDVLNSTASGQICTKAVMKESIGILSSLCSSQIDSEEDDDNEEVDDKHDPGGGFFAFYHTLFRQGDDRL
jgi:hypothetical protein